MPASRALGLGLGETRQGPLERRQVDSRRSSRASGSLRAGLVLVPLDPKLTERELRHVVERGEPARCDRRRPAGRGRFCAARTPRRSEELPAAPVLDQSASRTSGIGGARTYDQDIDAVRPDAPALIGFTSGTTGRTEGGGADACEPARKRRVAAVGLGLDT